MRTAKLFRNGRSQAVRLPKDFRFTGQEVFIKKTSQGVILIPKEESPLDICAGNLVKYDEPFMIARTQSEKQQCRVGLDELYD